MEAVLLDNTDSEELELEDEDVHLIAMEPTDTELSDMK
jgi:hypothetical protein